MGTQYLHWIGIEIHVFVIGYSFLSCYYCIYEPTLEFLVVVVSAVGACAVVFEEMVDNLPVKQVREVLHTD